MSPRILPNVSCVSIEGRGLLIEGAPGSGKSSLALALIDRGAVLVGDDAVALEVRGDRLFALPPTNIAGKIEIRGVGIATLPATCAPLCLSLLLGPQGDRLPEHAPRAIDGMTVPGLPFAATSGALGAEWALRIHGLPLPAQFA